MKLYNSLENNLNIESTVSLENQKSFLNSNIGKIVNESLNTGIRVLLPDIIEEQIIDIKDEIINNGFEAGVKESISSAMDLGKSVVGIFTGKFDNITQVRNAVKSGGIIDGISKALDYALSIVLKSKRVPSTIIEVLKTGKNAILDTISNNIEKSFDNQINSVEKINKYSTNWRNFYNNKNFEGMEKEYKKIGIELKKIIPLENTIKEARNIENLHKLIKNKGGKFNLTQQEIELAKKLA